MGLLKGWLWLSGEYLDVIRGEGLATIPFLDTRHYNIDNQE